MTFERRNGVPVITLEHSRILPNLTNTPWGRVELPAVSASAFAAW